MRWVAGLPCTEAWSASRVPATGTSAARKAPNAMPAPSQGLGIRAPAGKARVSRRRITTEKTSDSNGDSGSNPIPASNTAITARGNSGRKIAV